MYNFDPYNVLLAIDTNIPALLMTGSRVIYNTHNKHVKLGPLLILQYEKYSQAHTVMFFYSG